MGYFWIIINCIVDYACESKMHLWRDKISIVKSGLVVKLNNISLARRNSFEQEEFVWVDRHRGPSFRIIEIFFKREITTPWKLTYLFVTKVIQKQSKHLQIKLFLTKIYNYIKLQVQIRNFSLQNLSYTRTNMVPIRNTENDSWVLVPLRKISQHQCIKELIMELVPNSIM